MSLRRCCAYQGAFCCLPLPNSPPLSLPETRSAWLIPSLIFTLTMALIRSFAHALTHTLTHPLPHAFIQFLPFSVHSRFCLSQFIHSLTPTPLASALPPAHLPTAVAAHIQGHPSLRSCESGPILRFAAPLILSSGFAFK